MFDTTIAALLAYAALLLAPSGSSPLVLTLLVAAEWGEVAQTLVCCGLSVLLSVGVLIGLPALVLWLDWRRRKP